MADAATRAGHTAPVDTATQASADLDAAREALLASLSVEDAVREGIAAFEAATARVGNPTVMHFAPVTYSTTGDA